MSSNSAIRLKSRFHVLSFVLLAASVVGTPYAFGIFSMIFRHNLDYSQLDLSIVSSCGSTGLYTGVLVGLAIERYGPVIVLRVGAMFIFLGNMYVWLAVQKDVWYGVGPVAVAYTIAQMGTSCVTNVAMVVAIRIFPSAVTGQTAGLSKGYFGVSSAVLATVSTSFFPKPSPDFILFVALTLPLILLVASYNVNFLPGRYVSFSYERGGGWSPSLTPYVQHMFFVIVCILSIGACQHYWVMSSLISTMLGFLLSCVVISIILIPSFNKGPRNIFINEDDTSSEFNAQYQELDETSNTLPDDHSSCPGNPICYQRTMHDSVPSPDGSSIELQNKPRSRRRSSLESLESAFSYADIDADDEDVECELDYFDNDNDSGVIYESEVGMFGQVEFISYYGRHVPLSESLRTWRIYCIMVIFCIVAGSGILVINNIQAIAGAVNRQPSAFFVTIISLANAGGRVAIGIVADTSAGILSRFQLLGIISLVMALTQFLLSLGLTNLLYPCLLLTGAMFGATFSNTAAITSDVYGSKYVGSNYGFVDLAPTIGSYIFSVGLVAIYYPKDQHSEDYDGSSEEVDHSDNEMCKGAVCFQGACLVACGACVAATFLCLLLHVTTPIKN